MSSPPISVPVPIGAPSLAATLLQDVVVSPTKYVTIFVITVVFLLLKRASSPAHDAREPPLVKHRFIPIMGHVLDFLRLGNDFHKELYKKHPLPIASLPWGGVSKKTYVITDPALVQAAMRARTLDFEPFALEFAQGLLGVSDAEFANMPAMIHTFAKEISAGMVGDHLRSMNLRALDYIACELNGVGKGSFKQVDNLWLWARDLLTMATTEALYGKENPFRVHEGLAQDLWDFDDGAILLVPNILPRLLAPRAHHARQRIQAAFEDYYGADLDQDPAMAARVVQNRGRVLRTIGQLPSRTAGKFDFTMAQVGVVNTAPTLFWMLAYSIGDCTLRDKLRAELDPLVKLVSPQKATLSISLLGEEHTPTLTSLWWEVLRWGGVAFNMRRVLQDREISDGKGNSYLLRAGNDVHCPGIVIHHRDDIWGADADQFVGDRFVKPSSAANDPAVAAATKNRKMALNPFGGGKHLCPGRNFAFTEIMGLVAAVAVGFDVFGIGHREGEKPIPPKAGRANPIHAVEVPKGMGEGLCVRLERREGWEDAQWEFVL